MFLERGIFTLNQHIPMKGHGRWTFLFDLVLALTALFLICFFGTKVIVAYKEDVSDRSQTVNNDGLVMSVDITCAYSVNCTIQGSYNYSKCSHLPSLNINFNEGETVTVDVCRSPLSSDGYYLMLSRDPAIIGTTPVDEYYKFDKYANLTIDEFSYDFPGFATDMREIVTVTIISNPFIDKIQQIDSISYEVEWDSKRTKIQIYDCPSFVADGFYFANCFGFRLSLPSTTTYIYRERAISSSQLVASLSGLMTIWGVAATIGRMAKGGWVCGIKCIGDDDEKIENDVYQSNEDVELV